MIERLYFRNLLSFDEVELEFDRGLVVLSGPSGAGKSLLMSSILSAFGYSSQSTASLCELSLTKPSKLSSEVYELSDELTLKTLKKEKLRYFIDGQNISKKTLNLMFKPYVKYLSVRDKGGFESEALLELLDESLLTKDKSFKDIYKEYTKRYGNYKIKLSELKKIEEDEAKLAELIDYAKYEIEKIANINPKIDEEEELLRIKQQLSRIDKIKDALAGAMDIFNLEHHIEEVYRLLDKDASSFSDMMNQLRADFEETETLADELAEIDVEEVLNRLSDLSTLKNRYGSIEEALAYKEQKEQELLGYENISQDKSLLQNFLDLEFSHLHTLALKLSSLRQKEAKILENSLEHYLNTLKLPKLNFSFEKITLSEKGIDKVDVLLGSSKASTLSGGEFNRVRLALMATSIPLNKAKQGVLILDEIDANVSGDESIAIAQMIKKLSSVYQVFAISHQAHLSAKAKQHILITKEKEKSKVEILDEAGRIKEIARIIAGENPTNEALEFARKLRA